MLYRLVEFDASRYRLFQIRGAATAKALSPNFLRVRGRNRLPLSADRDEARDGRSATGLIRSAMYCGACPTIALWTSRHRLKSILSAISNKRLMPLKLPNNLPVKFNSVSNTQQVVVNNRTSSYFDRWYVLQLRCVKSRSCSVKVLKLRC